MQRYFALDKDLKLTLSDYHHIKNVMRMKKGDLIEVVYDNIVYKCRLINDHTFDVIEKIRPNENKIKITCAFPLLKEQKLDYIFQKATEVGVYKFIPLLVKRSVIKLNDKNKISKINRWNKIVKEAAEQSKRFDMPIIDKITDIDDLINCDADLKILLTVNEKTKNIKKVLQKNNKCDKILIATGPEGGFDNDEEKILIQNGFIPASLGDNVLRAETAPLVALSMINYEFMR